MSLLDERLRSTKHRRTIYLRLITFLCSKVGIGYNGIVVYQSMLYGDIIYTVGCHRVQQEGGCLINLLSDNDIHHAADGHYIGVSMVVGG